MKTSAEIIDMIYGYLKASSLSKILSGGIYPLQRPLDSDKEDLVINTITLGDGDVQTGVFNLNVHVPNIKVKLKGKEQEQPNRKRMRILSNLLRDLISEHYFDSCSAYITNITEIKEPTTGEWYVNHRLEIQSHNTDYQ